MKIINKTRFIKSLIVILIIGFAFWWFELRPYLSVKYCGNQVSKNLNTKFKNKIEDSLDAQRLYNVLYENCIHKQGL